MKRIVELFNISFLDLLSGALGAVIFLFIIVPKGEGAGPTDEPQIAVVFDTVQKHFYGILPDSLSYKKVGDSLLAVLIDFKKMPGLEDCPTPVPCPEQPKRSTTTTPAAATPAASTPSTQQTTTTRPPRYTGSMPDVPCVFSIELNWDDPSDNVDLFVCKDGDCVFGGRRFRNFIGHWDSGKSRTSIFGGDLRTSQEAVRQFDAIIPGEYVIFAQYKDALTPKSDLPVRGLVYTKNPDGDERGREFSFKLNVNPRERTRIGRLIVNTDGSFDLQLNK